VSSYRIFANGRPWLLLSSGTPTHYLARIQLSLHEQRVAACLRQRSGELRGRARSGRHLAYLQRVPSGVGRGVRLPAAPSHPRPRGRRASRAALLPARASEMAPRSHTARSRRAKVDLRFQRDGEQKTRWDASVREGSVEVEERPFCRRTPP
jgi:hypothetical protein